MSCSSLSVQFSEKCYIQSKSLLNKGVKPRKLSLYQCILNFSIFRNSDFISQVRHFDLLNWDSGLIFISNSDGQTAGLGIASCIALVHLMWLLYVSMIRFQICI